MYIIDLLCLAGQTNFYRVIVECSTLDIKLPAPKIIKIYFMLNSAEHEILNAHKYKNI